MSESKLIVVVGITGKQGSSVANTFLKLAGWRVRGITRSPSSAAAEAWRSKGAEIVQADLDDIQSLERAFSGASSIFTVTNFWAHFFDPANYPKAQQAGVSINEFACQRETTQGMNMAFAANSAAVLPTLTHYVFSSLSDTKAWSKGKYTQNFHFDGKAAVETRIRAELPALSAKLSTVQVGMYASNWKSSIGRPVKQDDGSFAILIPEGKQQQLPWVVVEKDTGIFVKALVEKPAGRSVLAYSQMATWSEFWTLWAEVIGVKVQVKEAGLAEYFEPLPEPARAEFQDSLLYILEFGYTGGDPEVVSLADLDSLAKVTNLKTYFETEEWSSLL
ncbi:hypothetical protein ACHAQA_003514 [Verticillium albo-atrum]